MFHVALRRKQNGIQEMSKSLLKRLHSNYNVRVTCFLRLIIITCMLTKAKWSEVAQSCPTLCDPMDCSLPGSSVHGIFQQGCWSGLPFPSPGDLPDPGIEPRPPALQADALPFELPGKPFQGKQGANELMSGRKVLFCVNYFTLYCFLLFYTTITKVSESITPVLEGKLYFVHLLSFVWICDPMDCCMLGFLVLHYLLEFAQTHVHWVGDTIQTSHPLTPLFPPAFNSQHQSHFQWTGSLY